MFCNSFFFMEQQVSNTGSKNEYPIESRQRVWGDNSVGKVFAVQVGAPGFDPQYPCYSKKKKRDRRTEKPCFKTQGGQSLGSTEDDLWPPRTHICMGCTHIQTCTQS